MDCVSQPAGVGDMLSNMTFPGFEKRSPGPKPV